MIQLNEKEQKLFEDIMKAIPVSKNRGHRIMAFIDGENLAAQYGETIKKDSFPQHVKYEKDIYAWSTILNVVLSGFDTIRKYYYTSVVGDEQRVHEIEDCLKDIDIETPRIFKRSKSRGAKGVDISIATDILTHVFKKNCDIIILVAGDGDYAPLINAVKKEGIRVFVWFFDGKGMSRSLKQEADHFWDLKTVFTSNDLDKLNVELKLELS